MKLKLENNQIFQKLVTIHLKIIEKIVNKVIEIV